MKRKAILSDERNLFVICIVASIFSYTETMAQASDTVYYNAKWEKTDRENKHFYRVIHRDDKKKPIRVEDYYPNGVKQMDGWYRSLEPEIRDGEFTWWHEDGKKHRWMIFDEGEAIKITEWDSNGKITRQQEKVKTVNYENGERSYEMKALEKAPIFNRGKSTFSDYVNKHFSYPTGAQGANGKVIVQFVVDKRGKTKDAKIVKSVNEVLDKAALDFIKSLPRWTPGVQDGKNVEITMELPVSFNN
ncbi:energy transducer TonB [Sphingobacterium gobiense]|nr:energy transducer TonB [Sphingobacterium gobiense]